MTARLDRDPAAAPRLSASRQLGEEHRDFVAGVGDERTPQVDAIGSHGPSGLLEVCDRVGSGVAGLARIFATLAHPLRLQLLARFDHPRMSPTELAERGEAAVPLGVVAYHVRKLCAAGLLELDELVAVRGSAEHFYRLTDCGHAVRQLLHHARSRPVPQPRA